MTLLALVTAWLLAALLISAGIAILARHEPAGEEDDRARLRPISPDPSAPMPPDWTAAVPSEDGLGAPRWTPPACAALPGGHAWVTQGPYRYCPRCEVFRRVRHLQAREGEE